MAKFTALLLPFCRWWPQETRKQFTTTTKYVNGFVIFFSWNYPRIKNDILTNPMLVRLYLITSRKSITYKTYYSSCNIHAFIFQLTILINNFTEFFSRPRQRELNRTPTQDDEDLFEAPEETPEPVPVVVSQPSVPVVTVQRPAHLKVRKSSKKPSPSPTRRSSQPPTSAPHNQSSPVRMRKGSNPPTPTTGGPRGAPFADGPPSPTRYNYRLACPTSPMLISRKRSSSVQSRFTAASSCGSAVALPTSGGVLPISGGVLPTSASSNTSVPVFEFRFFRIYRQFHEFFLVYQKRLLCKNEIIQYFFQFLIYFLFSCHFSWFWFFCHSKFSLESADVWVICYSNYLLDSFIVLEIFLICNFDRRTNIIFQFQLYFSISIYCISRQ